MIIEIALTLLTRDTGRWFLDNVEAAQNEMSQGRLAATVDLSIPGQKPQRMSIASEFIVDKRWMVAVQRSGDKHQPRQFYIDPQTITVFDPSTHQYAMRQLSQPAPLRKVMSIAEPSLDDFYFTMVDPPSRTKFFDSLRKVSPWEVKRGALTELTYHKQAQSITLTLDPKTNRWVGLRLHAVGQDSAWKLSWLSRTGDCQFHAPPNSYKVASIDPLLVEPVILDQKLRPLVKKMLHSFDRPAPIGLEVKGDGEQVSVWVTKDGVRQADGKADWFRRGKEFALYRKDNNTTYKGLATVSDVINAVAVTGTRVDPISRAFIKGSNPLRSLLSGMKMKKVGQSTIKGSACTLVEARLGDHGYNLAIRNSDGFPLSIATQVGEAHGASTSLGVRELRKLAMPPSDRALSLDIPSGSRVANLDDIIPDRKKPKS